MAQFFAAIQGSRGEATRLGGKASGIRAQAQGWDSGVTVYGSVDKDGNDVFQVIANGGTNRSKYPREICRIVNGEVTVDAEAVDFFNGFGGRPS